MNSTWEAHLQNADSRHKLGTVVYLGTGEGLRLPPVLALKAERIILIEPFLDAMMELKSNVASDPRCMLYPVAISDRDGQAPLHVLSMPDLSSLSAPVALHELFPGVRETAQLTVETVALKSLLADLNLPAQTKTKHILHLDCPGSEAAVLSQLSRDDTPFEAISLRCGAQPLYSEPHSADDLVQMVEALGYRVDSCNNSDPDFPEYWMSLDHQARAVHALEAHLSDAQKSLTTLQHEKTVIEKQLAQSAGDLKKSREMLAHVQDAQKKSQETLGETQQELSQTKDALTQSQDALAQTKEALAPSQEQLAQVQEQLQVVQAASRTAELSNIAQNTQIEELQKTGQNYQNDLVRERAESQTKIHALRDDLKAATTRNSELEVERDKARDAINTSLRLQTMQASDRNALQEKYQTLLAEKQGQDMLLQHVTSRLTETIAQAQKLTHDSAASPQKGAKPGAVPRKSTGRAPKAKKAPQV